MDVRQQLWVELAEKLDMLSPEVRCEQMMRHWRPDQIGQSQLQNVSDFRS